MHSGMCDEHASFRQKQHSSNTARDNGFGQRLVVALPRE